MPAGRRGSPTAGAVAASTPLLPPRAPTLLSCQRRIRGRRPLRSGASSGRRRNRRGGDGVPGVMRAESMDACCRERAPRALAHGPKFARAASPIVGSDTELLAYEAPHRAAVGAAVSLAHDRSDDRPDRLFVPRAHPLGSLGVGLQAAATMAASSSPPSSAASPSRSMIAAGSLPPSAPSLS